MVTGLSQGSPGSSRWPPSCPGCQEYLQYSVAQQCRFMHLQMPLHSCHLLWSIIWGMMAGKDINISFLPAPRSSTEDKTKNKARELAFRLLAKYFPFTWRLYVVLPTENKELCSYLALCARLLVHYGGEAKFYTTSGCSQTLWSIGLRPLGLLI